MSRKLVIGAIAVLAAAVAVAVIYRRLRRPQSPRGRTLVFQGAVLRSAASVDKQAPIAGVIVFARSGASAAQTRTGATGYFQLRLPRVLPQHPPIVLRFRRPGYRPLDLQGTNGKRLFIARLISTRPPPATTAVAGRSLPVLDIRVRYTVMSTSSVNVGSLVKTFRIQNAGNVPCRQNPCSPDGRWQAAGRSLTLDAGEGNVFRNARASCMAGPCPFTQIAPPHFRRHGRFLDIRARDWSDTATFFIEAEVFHPANSTEVRTSYPVIFGRDLNFTVPASAEGVSLEANVAGTAIVFPLGPEPNPVLPWASCTSRVTRRHYSEYRCSLQPGYRF